MKDKVKTLHCALWAESMGQIKRKFQCGLSNICVKLYFRLHKFSSNCCCLVAERGWLPLGGRPVCWRGCSGPPTLGWVGWGNVQTAHPKPRKVSHNQVNYIFLREQNDDGTHRWVPPAEKRIICLLVFINLIPVLRYTDGDRIHKQHLACHGMMKWYNFC